MNKEIKTFKEYLEMNPRPVIPNKEIEEFIEYAKTKYGLKINNSHCDCKEDAEWEIEDYIGDCVEALLLFSEFLREKNTT